MSSIKSIVYIGSAGVLSEWPLLRLLQAGQAIRAVAILEDTINQLQSKPRRIASLVQGEQRLPLQQPSLLELAADYEIPILTLTSPLDRCVESIASLKPDLILMSCFPKRLPEAIFNLPRFGGFNLHPSLLPKYRGPSPIHWQCQHKVRRTGISWHQVSQDFDQGDIAIQRELSLPRPMAKHELAATLAKLGADAALDLIRQIELGTLELQPQQESVASYYGFP